MTTKIRLFSYLALTAAFLLGLSINTAAADPPGWMRQAASATPPAYERDVPAVVLHDEEQAVLNGDGKLVSSENFAVRLLTKEGRRFAIARAAYLVSSGKVREITAWTIRRDGTIKHYDKKSVLDVISDPDDVYNEGRMKVIDGSDDVEIGDIFGYTLVSEESPLFYQDTWSLQGQLPMLVSRYSLTLPSGWKANSLTFNSPEIAPQMDGSRYTWEMRNLAGIRPEPLSPAVANLSPRIVVNYAPAKGDQSVSRAFANWADVSRWATALHDPQVIVDDNIAGKARDLTANALTELDKIRAIGNYVQSLQYISIDIGVGAGNGYKPRPSTLVLGRGYGDCKDKANLMRAMLKALKIDAYPIAIFSGDPSFVRAQWASPKQFNHCIIAVKVSAETKAPTIIENEKLGRLLIFDATDPHTPVGDLPDYLQDSMALIIAGDNGGLSRMPVTPPENDLLERTIEVDINEVGEIRGFIREIAKGQVSASFRREFRDSSAGGYRNAIEGWLTSGATGAKVDSVQTKEAADKSTFNLDIKFSAPRYGQLMQGRLLVFKPVIVGRRDGVYLTDTKRTNPVEINGSAMKETTVFTLPAGFVVDEMPTAVNLETAFGRYTTRCVVTGNKLHFTRTLVLNRTVLPVEKYAAAKEFFAKMLDAEQSPVVLIRK